MPPVTSWTESSPTPNTTWGETAPPSPTVTARFDSTGITFDDLAVAFDAVSLPGSIWQEITPAGSTTWTQVV